MLENNVHFIYYIKEKNQVIISKDTEKASNQIQNSIMIFKIKAIVKRNRQKHSERDDGYLLKIYSKLINVRNTTS